MISPVIGLWPMLSVTWLKVPPPTQNKSAFLRIYFVEHNRDNQFKVSLFFSLGHLRNANTAATEAIDTTNAIPIFSYPK